MELEELPFETVTDWGIEPHPWRGFTFLDKVIVVVLPLLAAGVFVLPFADHAMLRRLARLPAVGGITEWLVNSGGWWLVGLGLLLLWAGFILFQRWRISQDEHLWVDAGCPQCLERDLVRVSRERRDRWYGLLGIPAYRYACRNCTWRGLRLARRHRHLVLAQEQLITASSLTVEAAAAGTAGLALADMDFDDLAPDPSDVLTDVVELEEMELSGDGGALDEGSGVKDQDEPEPADAVEGAPEYDAAEPIEAESDGIGEAEQVTDPGAEAHEDDLDWLWRKLSDET